MMPRSRYYLRRWIHEAAGFSKDEQQGLAVHNQIALLLQHPHISHALLVTEMVREADAAAGTIFESRMRLCQASAVYVRAVVTTVIYVRRSRAGQHVTVELTSSVTALVAKIRDISNPQLATEIALSEAGSRCCHGAAI